MPWINSFLASTAVRRPGNLGRDKPFFSFLKKNGGGQNPSSALAKREEQKLMPQVFTDSAFLRARYLFITS